MTFIPQLQRDMIGESEKIWNGTTDRKTLDEQEWYRNDWMVAEEKKLIEKVKGKTLLNDTRLTNLIRCVRATMKVEGCQAELGAYRCGSAYVISKSNPAKTTYVFDNFENGIPVDDPGGHKKGDFGSKETDCRAFLKDCNVEIIPGIFPNTAQGLDLKFSLVHLDCDILNKEILDWFWSRLNYNGILVVDDYEQYDCPTIKPMIDSLGVSFYLENRQVIITKDKDKHFPFTYRKNPEGIKEIKIRHWLSPGDICVLTMAIESLHRQYPGQYLTDVEVTCRNDIFANNPHISRLKNPETLNINYSIPDSRERNTFGQAYCDDLAKLLNLPSLVNKCYKPMLYLSEDEKKPLPGMPENFVLLNAGYKHDCTIKNKGNHLIWQEVTDYLNSVGVKVYQIGEQNPTHTHPRMKGAIDMVGKTTMRQLILMASQCLCTLSPISLLTHLAAAFDKPGITLSSREALDFAGYRSTRWLSAWGTVPCCGGSSGTGGCWKNHLQEFQKDNKGQYLLDEAGKKKVTNDSCSLPVIQSDGSLIAKCNQLVGADTIVATLKPILRARGINTA